MSSVHTTSAESENGSAGSLGRRVARGTVWTTAGHGASQLLRFGGNLILTRLLFEDAFGLMLLVNVVLQGFAQVSDIGINASIVQNSRGDEPGFLDTAWTLQLLRAVILWLLCLALAGPIAGFYEQPELGDLIPVAAFSMLIGGLNSTSLARMQRHLELGRLTLIELGAQVTALVVMVVWAWIAPSVWALVAGALVSGMVQMVASHALQERRVRFALHRESMIAIVTFGGWIMINTPLGFAADQADRFAFGKLIPLALLGVYQIAVMLSTLPYQLLVRVGGAVIFPAFSRAREAGLPLADVYRQARVPVVTGGGLLIAGLAACGPVTIELLYDARWHAAAWMIPFIALGQWFRILSIPPANALFAQGTPQWLVAANGAKVLGYIVFVPAGFQALEMRGALVGFAAGEAVGFLTYVFGLRHHEITMGFDDLRASAFVFLTGVAGWWIARALVEADVHRVVALLAAGLATVSAWAPSTLPLLKTGRERLAG